MPRKYLQELNTKMNNGVITKFRYYTQLKGYTLQDVCTGTGLNKKRLDNYYRGEKKINTMDCEDALKIADFLQIGVRELFETV